MISRTFAHHDDELISNQNTSALSRRQFFDTSRLCLGPAALSLMLDGVNRSTVMADVPRITPETSLPVPHLPARIKRVIFLYMAGGPSQFETFDYKPELQKMDGQPMPESYTKGQPIAQLQGQELRCLGPLTRFRPSGQCGQIISDFLPWHRKMADDLCVIRSMVTEQINHDPAHTFMNTGTGLSGRPSMGAWVTYGLGSESQNLPGFVVMTSVGGRNPQPISSRQWSAGFLPGKFQGVEFNSTGAPVHYLDSPPGVDLEGQTRVVDTIRKLNQHRLNGRILPDLETRIAAYETAFRMQAAVPDLVDLSDEPKHILDMYGAVPGDGSFASNCLLARRMAERGVRFIQLYHRGWDHHGGLVGFMTTCSKLTDQPTWALVQDLKQRGMLDDTLILWGGEFGRTPMFQGKGGAGRDHHIKAFTMWAAGGGIRGGMSYGSTDELGYHAVEDVVHVRDLHATMLHLLGLDHERLTVRFQGLDMKLTGVEPAQVLHRILV